MVVNMVSDGKNAGFIYFDSRCRQREWSEEDQSQIKFLVEIIGKAITKKELTEDLMEARKKADTASKAKSQFVANMSHEIRTPLNGVIGFSELLTHTSLSSEQRTYLGYIASSGKNLLALVNDILDLSKIEAGKMELRLEPAQLEEICSTAMDSVRYKAYTKKLSLSLEMDPDLAHAMIEVDGDRLRQVLLNLLGNAVKFTQEGKVQLSVALEKAFDQEGYGELLFSVIDTGPGIAEELQNRLFEEYYQADGSLARKHGGTGLGLAISQRILQLMDSRLNLSSLLGHGSTFSFLLKVKNLNMAHTDRKIASSEEGQPQSDARAEWKIKPHKILIVEDNKINQWLIQALIKKHLPNAAISIAETGLEGVNKWMAFEPDLVLMDLHMPEMDGIEATQFIRSRETGRPTPIIALTAATEAQDSEKCIQSGMDGYLTKPVTVEALLKELEKGLGHNEIKA